MLQPRSQRPVVLSTILACAVSVWVIAGDSRPRSRTAMLDAAQAFLATLGPEQRQQASFPLSDEERFRWHYTPIARKGLPFSAMTDAQRQAGLALLRAGYGEKGYTKAETIRQIELVLREMEGRDSRDPDLYYFSFFGTPSGTGAWAWRYEGHHLSQHWTIVDGRARATTPQFFGVNPARVPSGPLKGTRVLSAEEDLGRALVQSLSPEQRAEAIVSSTAPPDIATTNARQAAIQEDRGIAFGRLTAEQQRGLLRLIDEYAAAQPTGVAEDRLKGLRAAGLDRIKFAWMGGLEPGQGHYYRVQGPTFLIEYDDTQNNANHIHTVWRDFKGDFGLDVLAEHYRAARHHDGDRPSADDRRTPK